jgi:hypothetical protein
MVILNRSVTIAISIQETYYLTFRLSWQVWKTEKIQNCQTKIKIKFNRFLHESLLKIWDFFHECEKFRLFTSGA